jgi:hypothetical protein
MKQLHATTKFALDFAALPPLKSQKREAPQALARESDNPGTSSDPCHPRSSAANFLVDAYAGKF